MQIAWAAASCTDRQFSCEVGLGAGCKGGGLFVSYMNPLNLVLPTNRIGYAVERVARNAINSRYSGLGQNIDQQVRYFFHGHPPFLTIDIFMFFSSIFAIPGGSETNAITS